MVCTTWAAPSRVRGSGDILHVNESRPHWRTLLQQHDITLVGMSMPFDIAVAHAMWPELADSIFDKFDRDEILCIEVIQRLIDIENGRLQRFYNLKEQVRRHLHEDLDKGEDTYRLKYKGLDRLPLENWPRKAKSYAIKDAAKTRDVFEKQLPQLPEIAAFETYASYALHLISCRGIVTDKVYVERLRKATAKELKRCKRTCIDHKLIVWDDKKGGYKKSRKNAQKRLISTLDSDTREAVEIAVTEHKAYGSRAAQKARSQVLFDYQLSERQYKHVEKRLARLLRRDISHKRRLEKWEAEGYSEALYKAMRGLERKPKPFRASGVKITKTGQISVDADACKTSQDPVLKAFATHTSANTLLLKAERMGFDGPLQTSYISPIETMRASSRAPGGDQVGDNFMCFRRGNMVTDLDEELPGQRECIIARPGYVLGSIDLDAAEMRGYAQLEYSHLGVSPLRDVLNKGRNPHLALAARILGITYKEAKRRKEAGDKVVILTAQFCKIPNFALLGGGGWRMLPDYARGMGLTLSNDHAKSLYDAFHEANPGVKKMHKHFSSFVHSVYEHPITGFRRYLTRYAQACNHPFQHLIAVVAKQCLIDCCKAEYRSDGELYGSFSVLFMHDEIVFEFLESHASEHAWRANRIVIAASNKYLKDVPMTCSPALMPRLSKNATTVICPKGRKDRDGNPLLLMCAA